MSPLPCRLFAPLPLLCTAMPTTCCSRAHTHNVLTPAGQAPQKLHVSAHSSCVKRSMHTLTHTREHTRPVERTRPVEHTESCLCMHAAHRRKTQACAQLYVSTRGALAGTAHHHSRGTHRQAAQGTLPPASGLTSLMHHLPAQGGICSVSPPRPPCRTGDSSAGLWSPPLLATQAPREGWGPAVP